MSFLYPVVEGEKPDKRSGHVAVCYNGYVIVWGGYHDIEAGVYMNEEDAMGFERYIPCDEIWLYNIEANLWTCIYVDENVSFEAGFEDSVVTKLPYSMSGSCAACVGHKVYLFGGHTERIGPTNEVYMLDLKLHQWMDITSRIEGEVRPSPRDKFCCWVHNECIIYFGGFGFSPSLSSGENHTGEFVLNTADELLDNRGWNNFIFVLDTENFKWIVPKVKGNPPEPRAAHASAKLGNKAYLFGGRFLDQRRSDLHCLDLDTWEWSGSLLTVGDIPEGRTWHSLTPVSDRHLFLYGGFNNHEEALGDAYILNTEILTWSRINVDKNLPSSQTVRMWHTACVTGTPGEVAIFGGSSASILDYGNPGHTNDVIIFRFSALPLTRIAADAVTRYYKEFKGIETHLKSLPKHVLRTILSPAKLSLLHLA